MNKRIAPILLVSVALLLAGCATLFQGIITLTEVRNSALQELAVLHVTGQLPPGTDAQIAAADAKYIKAADAAEKALIAYKNGGSKQNYINALEAVRVSITPLMDIFMSFGPVDKSTRLSSQLAKAKQL